MPKDRAVGSFPSERTRVSPYPNKSRNTKQCKQENLLGSVEDVEEWEEARCPICMEQPHNAVLLHCSSFEKGCRPYMCNTSYRHSNCLDQFCKSSVSSPSTATLQDNPPVSVTTASHGRREPFSLIGHSRPSVSFEPKLLCPLCRGGIFGWSVVEPARAYMNSKTRSCSSESCDFSGNYRELRRHARAEHPLARPMEVDPARQDEWTRLERERDYEDMRSSIQTMIDEGSSEENNSFGTRIRDGSLFSTLAVFATLISTLGSLGSTEVIPDGRSGSTIRFRYNLPETLNPSRHNGFPPERMPFASHNNSQSHGSYQGRRPSASQGARMARGRGLRWRTYNNSR